MQGVLPLHLVFEVIDLHNGLSDTFYFIFCELLNYFKPLLNLNSDLTSNFIFQ